MSPHLLERLVALVGRRGVVDDPTRLLTYESDSLALLHAPLNGGRLQDREQARGPAPPRIGRPS